MSEKTEGPRNYLQIEINSKRDEEDDVGQDNSRVFFFRSLLTPIMFIVQLTCFSLINNHLSICQGHKHFVVQIPKSRRKKEGCEKDIKHKTVLL